MLRLCCCRVIRRQLEIGCTNLPVLRNQPSWIGPHPTARKTSGMASGSSSAIRPEPKYGPHSGRNRAPTSAASIGFIPRAIQPVQKPTKRSPEPAVANQAADPSCGALTQHKPPSEEPIQALVPLRSTEHPHRWVAAFTISPCRSSPAEPSAFP